MGRRRFFRKPSVLLCGSLCLCGSGHLVLSKSLHDHAHILRADVGGHDEGHDRAEAFDHFDLQREAVKVVEEGVAGVAGEGTDELG